MFDDDRARKLFLRATDSASAPNEVQAAMRTLRRMFDAANIDVHRLRLSAVDDDHVDRIDDCYCDTIVDLENRLEEAEQVAESALEELARMTRNCDQLLAQLKHVIRDHEDLKTANVRLTVECERLRMADQLGAVDPQAQGPDPADEFVDASEIRAQASTLLGRSWRAILAYHLRMPIADLHAWMKVGLLPKRAAMTAVEALRQQPIKVARKTWTADEHAYLKAVLEEGLSDAEAAHAVSRRFGRIILETGVAARRRALRRSHTSTPTRRTNPYSYHAQSTARV